MRATSVIENGDITVMNFSVLSEGEVNFLTATWKAQGFKRVENSYWIEKWQKENQVCILERDF